MNIKIAKAYRTTSDEALCILTGTTPIELKAEEAANLYRITRDKQDHQLDQEVEPKIGHTRQTQLKLMSNRKETNTIQIFTDGSKNERGVRSGTAICIQKN